MICSDKTGFVNMGLGENIEHEEIANQFVDLVNDYARRLEMHKRMLSVDLKNGPDNIWAVIKEEYRKFKLRR